MMKKLSKIALLAAASAFMLAVFPACDNDDSGEPPSITAPGDSSSGEVEDERDNTTTYEVDITKLPFSVTDGLQDDGASNSNGKYKLKTGQTSLGNGYFKVVQGDKANSSYYTDTNRTKINAIELGKQSDGIYIEFTVTGNADVTVNVGSTGKTNDSYVAIVANNEEGTFDNARKVTGTTSTTITKECTSGTYRIVVVSDDTRKSNARITLLKAVQKEN